MFDYLIKKNNLRRFLLNQQLSEGGLKLSEDDLVFIKELITPPIIANDGVSIILSSILLC